MIDGKLYSTLMHKIYCFALVKILVPTSFLGKQKKYRRETKNTYILLILFPLTVKTQTIYSF